MNHEWRQEIENDESVRLYHEQRSSAENGSLDSEENGKKIFTEMKKFPHTVSIIFSIDADDLLSCLHTNQFMIAVAFKILQQKSFEYFADNFVQFSSTFSFFYSFNSILFRRR